MTKRDECPVCHMDMSSHKLQCPMRADGQWKFSINLPTKRDDMPALSYFLENSTFDMQRDAIRAYTLQYAEQRVREERAEDERLLMEALEALFCVSTVDDLAEYENLAGTSLKTIIDTAIAALRKRLGE